MLQPPSSHCCFLSSSVLRPGYRVKVRRGVWFTLRLIKTQLAVHATRQGISHVWIVFSYPAFVAHLFSFFSLAISVPTPPFSFSWCFSLQECAPDESEDVLLAKWLFGEEMSEGCGSERWRRQKEEGCRCDLSRNQQQMAGTKARRGDEQRGAGGSRELGSRGKQSKRSRAQGCTRGRELKSILHKCLCGGRDPP